MHKYHHNVIMGAKTSLKDKLLNIVTAQPKIATLGIGLAITFGMSLVVSGMIELQQAHAAVAGVVFSGIGQSASARSGSP